MRRTGRSSQSATREEDGGSLPLPDAGARDEAVTELAINLVVTAGAGTGKTSLLVERILYHALERGTPLARLAAITFTEKAAAELRERLEESLERVLQLSGAAPPPLDAKREADRVLLRLSDAARPDARVRAQRSLEALDEATVGTIHAFASEVLRRHAEAIDLDVHFQVDSDQAAHDSICGELWQGFIHEVLGETEIAPCWEYLLESMSLTAVETIARRLAAFDCPPELLAVNGAHDNDNDNDSHNDPAASQRDYIRALGKAAAPQLAAIREELRGSEGVRPQFLEVFATVERVFEVAAEEGALPPESVGAQLPGSCVPGKKAKVTNPAAMASTMKALLKRARELTALCPEIAAHLAEALAPFVRRFRAEYCRRGWVSFDALIVLTRDLLRDSRTVRRVEGGRFDHILVDEFQDTDPLQYEILFFLAEESSAAPVPRNAYDVRLTPGRLFIVGDAKQSIYRFRGADIAAYDRAVAVLCKQGGKVLHLRTNFRSVPDVIEPLNDLFADYFAEPAAGASDGTADPALRGRDPEYIPLACARADGERPAIEIWSVGQPGMRAGARRRQEADAMAAWIQREVIAGRLRPRDVAVLFRALPEIDVFLRAMRARGLPYVVEGGRGFYNRYEVELFLSFLRAVVTPADPVALLAYLRSPLGAVKDGELQRYGLLVGRRQAQDSASGLPQPAFWSSEARPDEKRFPGLARALTQLREFAAAHAGAPLDEIALAALDGVPLRLAAAVTYEGAQRVANLEKAAGHICELVAAGHWDAEEIFQAIEKEELLGSQQGDSPLADETVDAVSILSVHKAKGLEWPVVMVPDLARTHRSPVTGMELHFTRGVAPSGKPTGKHNEDGLPAAMALRMSGIRTPAFLWHKTQEDIELRAEAKRLFYVATTRARNRLILVAGPAGGVGEAALRAHRDRISASASWLAPLRRWGYHAADSSPSGSSWPPPAGPLCDGTIDHHVWDPNDFSATASDADAPDRSVMVAARKFQRVRLAMREEETCEGASAGTPSAAAGAAGLPAGDPATQRRQGVETGLGRAVGTATHLLLEVWDGDDVDWLFQNARRAAAVVAAREGLVVEAVAAAVDTLLQVARSSGQLAELQRQNIVWREVPLVFKDAAGNVWSGTVDALAGSAEEPEIIDYKTDAGKTEAELRKRYAAQLALYAEGVQRALTLNLRPRARPFPLRQKD